MKSSSPNGNGARSLGQTSIFNFAAVRFTGIVLAGIATSMGVESTGRQAYEHGYNVTVAADAVTDLNAEAHARSLDWIFPMVGEVGSTGEILALLPESNRWPLSMRVADVRQEIGHPSDQRKERTNQEDELNTCAIGDFSKDRRSNASHPKGQTKEKSPTSPTLPGINSWRKPEWPRRPTPGLC